MNAIRRRINKLEQQAKPTANVWEERMVRVLCRGYAREVAAGTRKPEDATEETALAELRSRRSTGGTLEERMRSAIQRGKPRRNGQEVCHG